MTSEGSGTATNDVLLDELLPELESATAVGDVSWGQIKVAH